MLETGRPERSRGLVNDEEAIRTMMETQEGGWRGRLGCDALGRWGLGDRCGGADKEDNRQGFLVSAAFAGMGRSGFQEIAVMEHS